MTKRPLSLRAVQSLKRLYGTEYKVGSGADLLYEASGASHDFAKGFLNIPYAFLVELRPQNTLHSTGFLLPEAEIMDTAEETWEAVKVVADEVLQRFGPFGEERKAWNASTILPPQTTSTTPTETEPTTSTPTTSTTTTTTTTTTKMTKNSTHTNRNRTNNFNANNFNDDDDDDDNNNNKNDKKGRTTRRQSKANKHTFKPNTIGATTKTLSKTLTSTADPSGSVRNVKSGTKMGKQRPTTSTSSSSATSSAENGNDRKTIVNVKICTGGRSGVIPPFPSPSPSPYSGEEGEGGTIMEILLPETPRRLIKCRDWSAYCKWWRMHSLCSDSRYIYSTPRHKQYTVFRVTKMCTLSCLIECQI
uniref:Peptidase_M14 domain-containing protein n=1 Tax=Globodera pallida TaxID=36090 RepID=A0A183C607_GLOPA